MDVDVIVLTNENTGSAAEMLAMALKDNHRATIFGESTAGALFGKDVHELDDGRAVIFRTEPTILSPTGVDYSTGGVTPHVEVTDNRTDDSDPVLQEAIRFVCTPIGQRLSQGLSASSLQYSVGEAKKGNSQLLDWVQRHFCRTEEIELPKNMLPIFTGLLKEEDIRIQRLGLMAIAHFGDPRSQADLVNYIKAKDPRKLEKTSRSPEFEPQYSHDMMARAYAVVILGDIGDDSVIPFLESLRGIRDLKVEWSGPVVDKAIEKIRERTSGGTR